MNEIKEIEEQKEQREEEEDDDEEEMFYFYSNSSNKKPGEGINEKLKLKSKNNFKDLEKINNWRQILSNFYESNFKYKNKHYKTVEHCFQSMKFIKISKEISELFTIESNTKLSKSNGNNARKERKRILLNKEELENWNNEKDQILEEILRAKFTQIKIAKEVLIKTKNIQLWHGARGITKTRQFILEKIRNELLINITNEEEELKELEEELKEEELKEREEEREEEIEFKKQRKENLLII